MPTSFCSPKLSYCTLSTPIGILQLAASPQALVRVQLLKDSSTEPYLADHNDILRAACQQLQEYFAGTRQDFHLPVSAQGTAFEQAVWTQLQQIPYATVCSYGDIARRCGHPQAFRAVGRACNHNPVLIVIPCHRVVGQTGKLTGFGCGIEIKEKLLRREGLDSKKIACQLYRNDTVSPQLFLPQI